MEIKIPYLKEIHSNKSITKQYFRIPQFTVNHKVLQKGISPVMDEDSRED